MKVHYEKTMIEKLEDALVQAKKDNRMIDHIELTPAEWHRLRDEVHEISNKSFNPVHIWASHRTQTGQYRGVPIKVTP